MPSRYNRYYDVCRMSGSFCSHSSDCIGILNGSSFYLPGSSFCDDRATQTAIQKIKSCSDFFASECLDLLQKAVDWSISFAAGSDARKTAFLQDISQGKDKEFLRDVLNTYRSNHESADLRGRCGYSIGSREYLNYVERKVLLVTGAALDALELYQTVEGDLHDADRKNIFSSCWNWRKLGTGCGGSKGRCRCRCCNQNSDYAWRGNGNRRCCWWSCTRYCRVLRR